MVQILGIVLSILVTFWAGYLIVAVLLFVGAGVFALVGKGKISKVKGKPERTIATSKETVEVVKRAAQN